MSKNQRQHRIAQLLEEQAVASQVDLVELLAAEGIDATQTTVSRDLDELGAVKVRLPGGETAYVVPELPAQQVTPSEHLRRILGEWVVEVAWSRNIVVLRTPPGSAHVVASAMDRGGMDGVLGTVAGDDTLLLVVAEDVETRSVVDALTSMAGLVPRRSSPRPSHSKRAGSVKAEAPGRSSSHAAPAGSAVASKRSRRIVRDLRSG